jgi:hypothetical protein
MSLASKAKAGKTNPVTRANGDGLGALGRGADAS